MGVRTSPWAFALVFFCSIFQDAGVQALMSKIQPARADDSGYLPENQAAEQLSNSVSDPSDLSSHRFSRSEVSSQNVLSATSDLEAAHHAIETAFQAVKKAVEAAAADRGMVLGHSEASTAVDAHSHSFASSTSYAGESAVATVDADATAVVEHRVVALTDAEVSALAELRTKLDSFTDATVGIEPVSIATATVMAVNMALKVARMIMLSWIATTMRMTAKQMEDVAKETSEQLESTMKLFNDVMGDMKQRVTDTMQEITLALVDALPADKAKGFVEKAVPASEVAGLAALAKAGGSTFYNDYLKRIVQGEMDATSGIDADYLKKSATAETQHTSQATDAAKLSSKDRVIQDIAPGLASIGKLLGAKAASVKTSIRQSGQMARNKIVNDMIIRKAGGKEVQPAEDDPVDLDSDPIADSPDSALDKELESLRGLMAAENTALTTASDNAKAKSEQTDAQLEEARESAKETMGEFTSMKQASAFGAGMLGNSDSLDDAFGELGGGNDYNDVTKNLGGAEDLAKSVAGVAALAGATAALISTAVDVYETWKVFRTAKFTSYRNIGFAVANSANRISEMQFTVCRLMTALYNQLLGYAMITSEAAGGLQLEKMLGAPALTNALPEPTLKALRKTIHAKLCYVLSPIRQRISALFRSGARCTILNKYAGAPELAKLDPKAVENTVFPRRATCVDTDIYDVKLATLADATTMTADGYEMVSGRYKLDGELNGDINVSGFFTKTSSGRFVAGKPAQSRVLYVLRCKAVKANPTKYPNAKLPLTDVRLIVRNLAPEAQVETAEQFEAFRSSEEVHAENAGYRLITFESKANPLVVNGDAAFTKSAKFWSTVKSRMWRGWWNSELKYVFKHTSPSDLNYQKSNDDPAIFVYAKFGGSTPLSQIVLVPIIQNEQEMDPNTASFVTWKLPSGATIGFKDTFEMKEFGVPADNCKMYCTKRFRSETKFESTGVRHVFTRLWKKLRGTLTEKDVITEFELKCDDDPLQTEAKPGTEGVKRWHRTTISPYEGLDDKKAMPRQAIMYLQKRYVTNAIPKPEEDSSLYACPDLCEVRKGSQGMLSTGSGQGGKKP